MTTALMDHSTLPREDVMLATVTLLEVKESIAVN